MTEPLTVCIRYAAQNGMPTVAKHALDDLAALTGFCEWKDVEGGMWKTACEKAHLFEYGDPTSNEYTYCPYCGKMIFIADETPEEE